MDKNLIWKSLLIVIVVGVAMLNLYPPQEKLKGGRDLLGGQLTSSISSRNAFATSSKSSLPTS